MHDGPKVLLIDDQPLPLRALTRLMKQRGYQVETAETGEAGLGMARRGDYDIAVVDHMLPGLQGDEVIQRMSQVAPQTPCVLITGAGSASKAFSALQAGAWDYFEKPIPDLERFFRALENAVQQRDLRKENAALRQERHNGLEGLIGNSKVMLGLKKMIADVATFEDVSVLVTGDSGTGKERVARAVHQASPRAKGPFVAMNCGAADGDLINTKLFGYVKGAFTGGDPRGRPGIFEEAKDGTVFLDEIGDMPLETQVKLLRVLQERRVTREGSHEAVPVNARVIAATHRPLQEMVQQGTFRQDLYFRLNVFPIQVPPLHERSEDIPLLAFFFLKEMNLNYGRKKNLSADALDLLCRHEFRGNNVRELQQALTRAFVRSGVDEVLQVAHFDQLNAAPSAPSGERGQAPSGEAFVSEDLMDQHYREAKEEVVERFSRAYLTRLLNQEGGNITRASERAGMRRENFKRTMRRYGVKKPT